jgi:hypothetical protein
VHYHPNLIFSVGTQVVTQVDIPGSAGLVLHPRGTVGVVVKSPTDLEHSYRVRFPDGFETPLKRNEVTMLAQFMEGQIGEKTQTVAQADLYERIIYRCVIGSQAYGLADAESDVDRRGIYLPTADQHWSLYGIPEQLENHATQEASLRYTSRTECWTSSRRKGDSSKEFRVTRLRRLGSTRSYAPCTRIVCMARGTSGYTARSRFSTGIVRNA